MIRATQLAGLPLPGLPWRMRCAVLLIELSRPTARAAD